MGVCEPRSKESATDYLILKLQRTSKWYEFSDKSKQITIQKRLFLLCKINFEPSKYRFRILCESNFQYWKVQPNIILLFTIWKQSMMSWIQSQGSYKFKSCQVFQNELFPFLCTLEISRAIPKHYNNAFCLFCSKNLHEWNLNNIFNS